MPRRALSVRRPLGLRAFKIEYGHRAYSRGRFVSIRRYGEGDTVESPA